MKIIKKKKMSLKEKNQSFESYGQSLEKGSIAKDYKIISIRRCWG
jgi:hypothetical protein